MNTVILHKPPDASGVVIRWLKAFFPVSTTAYEAAQEESFPTEEIVWVVETSIANMDTGRLSEPVNDRARRLFELLADELDEDW